MDLKNALTIALTLLNIYLGVTAAEALINFTRSYILSGVSALLSRYHGSVEAPAEVEAAKMRYDVDSFLRRISDIRDEDGLYDIPPEPPQSDDFTGTEIITNNYETDMDNHIRRNHES